MNANELQLNDLVWLDYSGIQEVGRVSSLYDDGEFQVLGGSAYVDDASKYCTPIELTEEILLANKFHPMEVAWSRDPLLGGFVFAFLNPIDGKMHGLFGIRYVHALQHFLRIFGWFDLADDFELK